MKTVKQLCLPSIICFGLLTFGNKAFSQAAPPAGGPPTPPPPPSELFKKINPFKKKSKTDTTKAAGKSKTVTAQPQAPAAGGPPPPPNPLNLFKKKKKDAPSAPPAPPNPPQ